LWGHLAKLLRGIGVFFLLWPFLPPMLRAFNLDSIAYALEYPWALTCHRYAERTIHIFSNSMPMCSRCAGISIGIGLGLVFGKPYYGPKVMWAWLVVATILMIVDIYTLSAGPHVYHPSRLATGALLSFPVAAAVSAIVRREANKA
jgi:uncharacterized membrane protein